MSQASPSPLTEGDTNQKCTDRSLIATTHKYLGVDAEGFHHHANEPRGLVYRIGAAGEIERVTELAGRHLDTYIEFVAAQVGWADRQMIKAKTLLGGTGGCSSDLESETRASEQLLHSVVFPVDIACQAGDQQSGYDHDRGEH